MYQIFLTKQSVKQIKKQGKSFKTEVANILRQLSADPYNPKTERLTGQLHFIWSYHFTFSGTSHRLAYTVSEKEKSLTVISVGPRENFYQILKKRL